MASLARVDSLATEIVNAFQYDKGLAKEVARSNLVTLFNEGIEEAAEAAEKALLFSDGVLIGTIIRGLRMAD
jgi:hypothetical protein